MRLRQLTFEDFPTIEKWASREELSEYFRRLPPAFAWSTPQSFQSVSNTMFMVEEAGAGIGLLCFANIDNQNKKFECGVLIDPLLCKDRRQASLDAYDQAFEYFFNYLGFKRAECAVLVHRDSLVKWLVSEGWKIEGLSRKSAFFKGQFQDEIKLSYLDEDFRGRGPIKSADSK